MKTQHVLDAPGESQESFAALAAAVHPAWHQAILRLANASERVAFRLEAMIGTPIDRGMAQHARQLVKDLIDFLDQIDPDPDLEPTLALFSIHREAGADECEVPEDAEPSLGSFDRMTDQTKAWRVNDGWACGVDNEHDDSDREDDDPAEESEPSGIGDFDGLHEQVGTQDWQEGAMG